MSCFAKDVIIKGTSLSFEVNDKKITGSAGGDNYTFSMKNGRSFTLSPIADVKPEMIGDVLKKTEKEMAKNIKQGKSISVNLKIKSNIHSITYGIFSGKELSVMTIRPDPVANVEYVQCTYVFLLWDGKTCWKGSYGCAVKGEAGVIYNILKSGKRIK